jgi:anion-transporting  ArsA/GET3 family ATPase
VNDPDARQRILDNPFYQSLTSQYAGSEAYAALQQLYDLHQTGTFDIEIVDTPPAAHAFEFLQAPARLARLLDSRSARWLFTPSLAASRLAMRLASQAARFVVRELERFVGASVLTTISDFFAAASEAVDGMVDRMHKTQALLHSPSVHFILVTTAEEDRLRRARQLAAEMEHHGLCLDAIVINRFLDEETFSAAARNPAAEPSHLDALHRLPAGLLNETEHSRGLGSLVNYLEGYRARARDDLDRVGRFARELAPAVELAICPEIDVGVRDLGALWRIAGFLMQSAKRLQEPERAPHAPPHRRERKTPAHRPGHH